MYVLVNTDADAGDDDGNKDLLDSCHRAVRSLHPPSTETDCLEVSVQ